MGNLSAQEREAAPRYFDFLQLKTILPIYAPDGRYIEAWQALYELSLPLAPAQDSLPRPPRVLLEGEYLSLELRGAYLAKAVFAHLPVQARRGSDLFAERFTQPAAMLFKRVNGQFLAPFFMGENGASPACKEAVGVGEMEDERPVPYSSFFGKPAILYIHYVEDYPVKDSQDAYTKTFNEALLKNYHISFRDTVKRAASLIQEKMDTLNINLEVVCNAGRNTRLLTIDEFRKIRGGDNVLSFYMAISSSDFFKSEYKEGQENGGFTENGLRFALSDGDFKVLGQAAKNWQFAAKLHADKANHALGQEDEDKYGWTKEIKKIKQEFGKQAKEHLELFCAEFLATAIEHEVLHNKIDLHPFDDNPSIGTGGHVDSSNGYVDNLIMGTSLLFSPRIMAYDPYMVAMLRLLHGQRYVHYPKGMPRQRIPPKAFFTATPPELLTKTNFQGEVFIDLMKKEVQPYLRSWSPLPGDEIDKVRSMRNFIKKNRELHEQWDKASKEELYELFEWLVNFYLETGLVRRHALVYSEVRTDFKTKYNHGKDKGREALFLTNLAKANRLPEPTILRGE